MSSGVSFLGSSVGVELLERFRELSALEECMEGVQRSARGRALVIGGEAGVGKTALVRRFCDGRAAGVRVVIGTCDPLFTPCPLGAVLDVAESVGGELDAVVAGDAKPYEVVAALLRELERLTPTILVFEDLHWADEATLDVFRLLVRKIETVPALVVATYRDDGLDHGHQLRMVLGELATSRLVVRLSLAPLSPSAVAELAEPHGVDAEDLYRKTAGNPFFVVEALASGAEEVPPTVRDAVLARTARLSPSGRALVEVVAATPPQAEEWLLAALAEGDAGALDECLMSGILVPEPAGFVFRHELARLAVEESIPSARKLDLHRRALAALSAPPVGAPDLARLAHHAEAAGDGDAVLRYAPAAGDRAALLGAHREAAAQYSRALRFGQSLSVDEQATLLEQRAAECYLTDQYDDGIAALEAELECRRATGDARKEGDVLRRLSEFLWCPGRSAESRAAARAAVELLEDLPPSRELAWAYAGMASACLADTHMTEAAAWAQRALDLAEELDETEIAVNALGTLGVAVFNGGSARLEEALDRALQFGLQEQAGRLYVLLTATALDAHRHATATRHLDAGLAYCSDRGLELFRLYLVATRAGLALEAGRWAEAAESAASVLSIRRTSISPRISALVVLALVRLRRGDPGHRALLDEAWLLAEPTGELARMGPVAEARAEAAWLAGDADAVASSTDATRALAAARGQGTRDLDVWLRRAGIDSEGDDHYDPARATESWIAAGCPYEAALAAADTGEEASLRWALEQLQQLEAKPAAAIVARRLREQGVQGLPRGPRPSTRQNHANLTSRELEVLALLAAGLRNAEIATRLVLSPRTVDHHVSKILRKLAVATRAQAAAEAIRSGLVDQNR